jgi:hypothetical protein
VKLGHLQQADAKRYARVRSGPIRLARRWRLPQLCDATGPMRSARPILGPNLDQVCIGTDAAGRRARPPSFTVGLLGSDTLVGHNTNIISLQVDTPIIKRAHKTKKAYPTGRLRCRRRRPGAGSRGYVAATAAS